jgi:hypothetical protein
LYAALYFQLLEAQFQELLYVPLEEGYNFAINVINKSYDQGLCKHLQVIGFSFHFAKGSSTHARENKPTIFCIAVRTVVEIDLALD